jgi:hypothetical protein
MHYFREINSEGVEERKMLEVELVRYFFEKTYRVFFMQEMVSNESFSYFLRQFFSFKLSGTINKINEDESGLQIWQFNVFLPHVDENGSEQVANLTFTITHQLPVQEVEAVEEVQGIAPVMKIVKASPSKKKATKQKPTVLKKKAAKKGAKRK